MTQPKKKSSKLTDAERHKRFVEAAKKVEASEKSEDFDKGFDSLRLNPIQEDVSKAKSIDSG
jgi:hypothetical protein